MNTIDESSSWRTQVDWRADEAGVRRGDIDPSWAQGRATFGGLVAGGLLRSMERLLEPERRLRSLQVSFVGPVAPGPVEARCEVLRAGRSLSLVTGEVLQEGAVRCVAQGAFGGPRPTAFSVAPPALPEVPPPEDLMQLPFIEGVTPSFTRHFDYRWTHHGFPFTGADEAWVQGWVRHNAAGVEVDSAALLGLLDSWPAPFLSITDRPFPASSVTWQVQLLADLQGLAKPGDWFLYDARTTSSGEGYSDFEAALWHQSGALVARSRQLLAEFSGR